MNKANTLEQKARKYRGMFEVDKEIKTQNFFGGEKRKRSVFKNQREKKSFQKLDYTTIANRPTNRNSRVIKKTHI